MKICQDCGERNFIKPGDEVKECRACGKPFKKDSGNMAPEHCRSPNPESSLKKLQHDEYPWEK